MTRRLSPRLFLFLSFCLGITGPSAADVTLFSPSSQTNPLNNANDFARSAAMGSAFTGVADDASALFTNPAGLGFLRQGQVFLNSDLWLVGTFQESALAGLPSGNLGGFGFAAQYLDYGTFEGRDESGTLTPSYSGNRWGLQAGWGIPVARELALGLGLSVLQTTLAGVGNTSFSSNLGALWKPQGGFALGASYVNAGWVSPGGPSEDAVNLGASYQTRLDSSNRILLAAGGAIEPNAVSYLQAGIEYSLDQQLFLRVGYQQPLSDNDLGGLSDLTAGVGFQLSSFSLDYAYLPYGDLGAAHRVSVGYFFGPEHPPASSSRKGTAPSGGKPVAGGAALRSGGTTGSSVAALPPLPGLPGLPGSTGPNPQGQALPSLPGSTTPPASPGGLPGGSVSGNGGSSPSGSPALGQNPKAVSATGEKDSLVVQFDMPDDSATAQTSTPGLTAPSGADLEKQGKYREAAQAYLAAVGQNPQDASSWWALGNLYRRFNQKDSAVRCFEKVLQLKPGSKGLADWLEQYKASQP